MGKYAEYTRNTFLENNNQFKIDWNAYGANPFYNRTAVGQSIESCVSIFNFFGQLAANRESDSSDSETTSKNHDAIVEKEKELRELYTNAGFEQRADVVAKINEQETDITTKKTALTTAHGEVDALKDQIKNLDQQDPNYSTKKTNLEAQLSAAEEAEKKKEEELTKAMAAKLELQTLLGEADNLELEIEELRGKDTGVSYDVVQETQDINNFMKALTAFKNDPSKETAQKLKDSYQKKDETGLGIHTKSIQDAYELVKTDVEKYINQQSTPPVQPAS